MTTDQPGKSAAATVRKIADRLLDAGVFSDEPWASSIRARRFDEAAQMVEQALVQNAADPKMGGYELPAGVSKQYPKASMSRFCVARSACTSMRRRCSIA